MDIHNKVNQMMIDIITPEFLEMVERWARYDGEDFSIGDADILVSNLGTFETSSSMPKMTVVNGKLKFDKTKKEIHKTYYDVTLIKNSATVSKYNKRILIAKRYADCYLGDGLEILMERPADIKVFAIDEDYDEHKADDSQYTSFPTLERLKKDFEAENYMPYHSLIYNFCGRYQLSRYNDNSDRIACYTGIAMDLESLMCVASDKIKHIENIPRLKNVTDVERKDLIKK